MFEALRYRNFRLLWIGVGVSFAGSFMQQAALLWHVSLLVPDHKGLALGLVGLARVVPIVVFSLLSGAAADVFDRRKLMYVTNIGGAAVALTLAVLAFSGLRVAWPIYLLAAAGASVGAFDPPARHSLVPMLVPREHLPNAISLNTVIVQAASVTGPALGGAIIAIGNVGWAYAIDAASFLFVVGSLVLMRDVPATDRTHASARDTISLAAIRDGIHFVFSRPIIRSTMLLDFFATFFSSATALLPIFAQDVLQVGPKGYGWLYAAPAIGAVLASALMVPVSHRLHRRGPTLIWAVAMYGVATAVFGISRSFWITLGCLAFAGASDAVSMIIRNLVRQLETPDAMRGRMVGINMIFFMGGPQLGELEAGLVANSFGAPWSVVTGGLGCLIATGIIVAITPELRAYRK
ncbi:MAG TPA: MFS transporter [Vicinamibacterales bacterium]|nr:MFS transporter [Vicinamibacterales bacterium]